MLYAKFAYLSDGSVLSISDAGEVLLTPSTGNERVMQKRYELVDGTYRAYVKVKNNVYDLYDILRDNFSGQVGFAYNRHGQYKCCSLSDLIVLPDPARPIKVDDIYVARTEFGEIVAANTNFDAFVKSFAEAIHAQSAEVRKAMKAYFGTSKHVAQPISDTELLLTRSDEDKPGLYHEGVRAETLRFLQAYDRTTLVGRTAIKKFIESCPVYEQKVYLRWIYTMKATHKETAEAMDICAPLLKYSIRGSALRWATEKLKNERYWFDYLF